MGDPLIAGVEVVGWLVARGQLGLGGVAIVGGGGLGGVGGGVLETPVCSDGSISDGLPFQWR